MGYVSRFQYDIFISYAHVDNTMDALGVKWVSEFQAYLKQAVEQHMGGLEVSVFFDERSLETAERIDAVLTKAQHSAILVPIVSTAFVKRVWTQNELEAFVKAASEQNTLFAAELLPPADGYPPALESLKRAVFWLRDEREGVAPRKLSSKCEAATYARKLDDLAFLIAKRLRELQPADDAAPESRPFDSSLKGKNILVADVTDDLKSERMELCKYLELYNATVFPASGYSDDDAKFVQAFESDIQHVDLFVQLLTQVRSPKMAATQSGDVSSRARFQFEKAKENGIPVLQWLRPGSDPTTVTHWDKPVIDGSLPGSNIETGGLVQFKTSIKEALEQKPVPPVPPGSNGFYFINADRSDQDIVGNVLTSLKSKNYDALGPLFLDTAASEEIETDRESNLIDCKGLVLVYGK